MNSKSLRPLVLLGAAMLAGCGDILVTVPTELSTPQRATFRANRGGRLAAWSLLNVDWRGQLGLRYDLTISSLDGVVVGQASCDALAVRVKLISVRSTSRGWHHRRQEARMECNLSVPSEGEYTLQAAIIAEPRPEDLRMRQAAIRLRQ